MSKTKEIESAAKIQNYINRLAANDQTLDTIDLSDCQLSDKDFALLTKAIMESKLTNFTSVNFSHTQISAKNLPILLESLQKKEIKKLALMDCSISDENTIIIANFLKKNTSLETILLSDNHIADRGLYYLSEVLRNNSNLRNLDLANNNISDTHIQFLSSVLAENFTLQRLSLAGNKITDIGADILIQSFTKIAHHNPEEKTTKRSLIDLDLSRNRTSPLVPNSTSTLISKYKFVERIERISKKDQTPIAKFFDNDGNLTLDPKATFPIHIIVIVEGEKKLFKLKNSKNIETILRDLYFINNQQISYEKLENLESLLAQNRETKTEDPTGKLSNKMKQLLLELKDDENLKNSNIKQKDKITREQARNKAISKLPIQTQTLLLDLNSNDKDLISLDISESHISNEALGFIFDAIKTNTVLKTLKLDLDKLSDSGIKFLSEALETNKSVTKIELVGNVSKDVLKILNSTLDKNKTLVEIDGIISSSGFKGIGERRDIINQIQAKLSANKLLAKSEEKDVQESQITQPNGEISEELSGYLKKLQENDPKLRELRLNQSQITDDQLTSLSDSIAQNQSPLTKINLGDNQISDQGLKALTPALSLVGKNITHLNLSKNNISDAGIIDFFGFLKVHGTKLESINLEGNEIGKGGIVAIAELLKTNQTITELNLSSSQESIGDEEFAILAEGLKENTTLKKLVFKDNQVTGKSLGKLAELINTNHTLEEIDLGKNHLNLKELQTEYETVEELDEMYKSPIDDKEWQPLADAIKTNRGLTKLVLEKEMSYNAAKILVDAMEHNHNITYLEISYNREEEKQHSEAQMKDGVENKETTAHYPTLDDRLQSYLERNSLEKAEAKNSKNTSPIANNESIAPQTSNTKPSPKPGEPVSSKLVTTEIVR